MQDVQERTYRLLEFDKIKAQLAQQAASPLGKEKARQLTPFFELSQARQAQQGTREAAKLLRLQGELPLAGLKDIRPALRRAKLGSTLPAEELAAIARLITAGRRTKQVLRELTEQEEDLLLLRQLQQALAPLREVEEKIKTCVDDEGRVLDTASPELRQIRVRIYQAEQRAKRALEQILRSPHYQPMLQEPIVTLREGRYCLPVKAEHRHHFGGLIHDQSASGATFFIEPEQVLTANNQLREARLEEEREIERILSRLTALVGEVAQPLQRNVEVLAELDFLLAKAYYAEQLRAVPPELNDRGYFKLIEARHPLIPGEEVVPSSFELGGEYRCMVITGPNTGGKTVTLKTLGLVTLMACAGLFIPAEEGSQVAVVSSVFADIGDEQSIEQSLSTFSSHMKHVVAILNQMDERSLLLLDELGAGTDPSEGAALAMAILDAVHARGARAVATTHFSELKAYASSRSGVINASVEFDAESLQPTYRLLVGVPGRSNAFHIAAKLGLDRKIIEQAREELGSDSRRIEQMLADLEASRLQADEERREAARLRAELSELRQRLAEKEASFEREKERLMARVREKTEQRMRLLVAEAEEIIRQLRERQVEQGVKEHHLIEAKKGLALLQEAVAEEKGRSRPPHLRQRKKNTVFNVGDEVYLPALNQKGQIVGKLSADEYYVQIGMMKLKLKAAEMERVTAQQAPEKAVIRIDAPKEGLGLELDIRGQTVDEAVANVDKYLDDALLAGYQQVSIIHGKGTGQLRKGIQEFLRQHKRVKHFRMGGMGEGGSGVTVVHLR